MKTLALCATLLVPALAAADPPSPGAPAPGFSLSGDDGKEHRLADYRGKLVVLEWFNNDCPFVRKHYGAPRRNMQALQERFTKEGVAWLTVVSSAPGKQGHLDGTGAAKAVRDANGSRQTAILFDPEGTVGRAYGATATPHMFLISKEGSLLYRGAIDDRRSADMDDIDGARNYVVEAVEAAKAGRPVPVARTEAYGCSVKYGA